MVPVSARGLGVLRLRVALSGSGREAAAGERGAERVIPLVGGKAIREAAEAGADLTRKADVPPIGGGGGGRGVVAAAGHEPWDVWDDPFNVLGQTGHLGDETHQVLRYSDVGSRAGIAPGGTGPNRIYSARELIRRAEESGPFHNFPGSVDDVIFSQGQRTTMPGFWRTPRPGLSNDSIQYRLPGNINGTEGTFEIFVRPSVLGRTEVITHRFFRPD